MRGIIKYKSLLLLFLFILGVAGCVKDFEELNQNPFLPTAVVDGALFNEIISSLRLGHNRQLYLHNEKLYQATQLAALTAETFQNPSIGLEDVWGNYYRALANARELESRFENYTGDPEALVNVHAQLKIIMAYKTLHITDLFGDIPYFEAGKSYQDVSNLRPIFDDQESIYKSCIADLESAVEVLSAPTLPTTPAGEPYASFESFDTFFKNDFGKWIKFANGLQLRHLVRMVEVDPEYAKPRIGKLITEGASFIGKNEDIVMSPREQSWDNWGLNWSFREHNKIRMGSNLWNYMRSGGQVIDPRANIFFETNNEEEWKPYPQVPNNNTPQSGGEPYFQDKRDASYTNKGSGNIYSNLNYYLVRDNWDIPEIIMTYAEVRFLLAEVYLRGLGIAPEPSIADIRYQEGMFESMLFWQNIMQNSLIWINNVQVLTTGELFQAIDHPKYNFQAAASDEDRLDLIYAQRWIDAFRQPWEAFALVRRVNNRLPREGGPNELFRFKYPPSEKNNNADNWMQQANKMGGDENNVKIWWMP